MARAATKKPKSAKSGDSPKKRTWLTTAVAVIVVTLAGFLLFRTLNQYRFEEIVESLGAISSRQFVLMIIFAAASYVALTGFDWLALHYIGKPLAYRKVVLASFCSLSLGHNIGFAALSSGAIRYRFYTRWGVGPADVARIIVFCGLTVGLGLLVLGGLAMLVRFDLASRVTSLSQPACIALGMCCLATASAYLVLSIFRKKPLRFRRWCVEIPSTRLAIGQVVIGTVNYAFVAACLYSALATAGDIEYLEVAAVYVIGNVTSLISHVPGGLGVLETVVRYLLAGTQTIGALIAFRAAYYLLPLSIGGPLFALTELLLKRRPKNKEACVRSAWL